MQGLNLRRRECVLCGDAIKGKGRIDRIYCSASCRTLAWRARAGKRWTGRRMQADEPKPGDYLPRGALTQFAMRLESELVTARRRIAELEGRGDVSADSVPQIVLDNISSPEASTEDVASPDVNTATERARTSDDVSASALHEELERLRAELADEQARSAAREKQLIDEAEDQFHDFVEARQDLSAVESTNKQLSKQLGELRGQFDQAQAQIAQLAIEREQDQHSAALALQIAEVQAKHRTETVEKDRQICSLSRQNAEQGELIEELRATLRGAQQEEQRLAGLEQSWREHCGEVQREHEASRAECDQLRATIEKLRAMSPEQDPLMFLMRTKVKLMHLVAIANEPLGVVISGRRLPDDDPKTLRDAAIYAAYEARQEYYASASVYSTSRTHWLQAGRRLDAESEEALRQQQQYAVKRLEDDLSYVRQCMK